MPRRSPSKQILRAAKKLANHPCWDNFHPLKKLCREYNMSLCGVPFHACKATNCPLSRTKPIGSEHGEIFLCTLISLPNGGMGLGNNARKRQERLYWSVWEGHIVLGIHRFLAWWEVKNDVNP
jgi:hypothetical protein